MNFLLWIVFGAVVGWVASMIMKTNDQQGMVMNIVFGVIGAFLGGWLFEMFGAQGVTGFNLYSFVVALVGAVVVIGLAKVVMKK
jgi:uncharacterized membrane protein YeaQ/YmgE (transglycosylase-associated protein family)